jgi:hypothetical protein
MVVLRAADMSDLRTKHLKQLTGFIPEFAHYWEKNSWLNGSDLGEYTLSDVYLDASHFVGDRLQVGEVSGVPEILGYVEFILESGSEKEKAAAATCFLENLMNITPSRINPKLWIPLLGEKSRKYCHYWDKWTGCRTEYLYQPDAP